MAGLVHSAAMKHPEIQQLPLGDALILSDEELRRAVNHANLMADAAAVVTTGYFRTPIEVANKAADGNFDPVTEADRLAEARIREFIHEYRPHDGVFGEEQGYEAGSSGLTWVIDPIDGTRSFIAGIPLWGTLIALYDGQRSIFGLLDQPYLGERYTGSRLGATLGLAGGTSRELAVLQDRPLNEGLLISTAPELFDENESPGFRRVASAVATVRYGTDCYGYAMLASGFADLVIETALQPYDIQALIPIIEAAGGIITDWEGEAVKSGGRVVAASSTSLHEQAMKLLAQTGS